MYFSGAASLFLLLNGILCLIELFLKLSTIDKILSSPFQMHMKRTPRSPKKNHKDIFVYAQG